MPIDTLADTLARLHMRNITKTFPGVMANDRVSLTVQAGEIHALLGENGAGKTTLMRILYGLYQPDAGDILLRGQPVRIRSPQQAMALGIGLVSQQFLLVRQHTVAENLALGLPGRGWLFPLRHIAQRLRGLEEHYGLIVDPDASIWQLSPGEQQRVEIVKALLHGGEILILDEPTGLLTPQETQVLFQGLQRMRDAGHAIIFITRRLGEALELADGITVLRQGRVVATVASAEATQRSLARLMVGREVVLERPQRQGAPGAPVLTVNHLWAQNDRGQPALRHISFTLHQGELLGVVGVAGNGQHEAGALWFGLFSTRWGIVLRSVGEFPAAADALGVSVSLVRYLSVVWGGMLAGVAGGFLSIAYLPAWTQGMTAGMGWIAIALTIFAAWNPLQAIWGACFFGALYHLSFRLQAWIAPALLQMVPYACTLLMLALTASRLHHRRGARALDLRLVQPRRRQRSHRSPHC